MNKTRYVIAAVVAAFIVGGFFAYRKYQQNTSIRIKPRKGNVIESIYGLGTVVEQQVFHVRVGVNLSIRKLFVQEGQVVSAGTPLVKLDESLIKTPIDGTVTEVAFKEGENVPAQASVVTVTNLEKLYLEVSLEQQSILRVKPGQKVALSFESLRSEKVEGVVKSIFPKSNQFIVRIDLAKWPTGVLPGMTADAAILVGEKNDVLLIPIKAIVGGKVIRIRQNKKEKIPVQLGVIDDQWAEVISNNISTEDELLVRSE